MFGCSTRVRRPTYSLNSGSSSAKPENTFSWQDQPFIILSRQTSSNTKFFAHEAHRPKFEFETQPKRFVSSSRRDSRWISIQQNILRVRLAIIRDRQQSGRPYLERSYPKRGATAGQHRQDSRTGFCPWLSSTRYNQRRPRSEGNKHKTKTMKIKLRIF
jgi:hypothetical protein